MKIRLLHAALLILAILNLGCTPIVIAPPKRVVEPYRDVNTYLHGNWALLAQSSTRYWYWEPESMFQDEDGVISFWAYLNPQHEIHVANEATLLHSKAYGPYLQKIDCFTQLHASESLIDGSCDLSENLKEVQDGAIVDSFECWRRIKPKTAIGYIANRVCGRKFPMESGRNYFLFQEEKLPLTNYPPSKNFAHNPTQVQSSHEVVFYDVINNEYLLLDAKNNIRQMRVTSYYLNKSLLPQKDFIYQANCSEKTDGIFTAGKNISHLKRVGDLTSLSGIAFNRLCGDHGQYMKLVKNYTK